MTTKSILPAVQVAEPILTDELPPLPELDTLADIKYAHEWPDDWDADYRSTWQKLQVAERNKMQWRAYALDLRAALGRAVAPSEPVQAKGDCIPSSLGVLVRVRIKPGTIISQDMRSMKWPVCLAPRGRKIDPGMIFDATWNGNYWDCVAPGYGMRGDYGNGSIFVSDIDGVELAVLATQAPATVPKAEASEDARDAARVAMSKEWRDTIQGAIDELPYRHYLIPKLVAMLADVSQAKHDELERIKRIAACSTVDSFLVLPEQDKRYLFAMAWQESDLRKKAEERLAFLHSTNKDADGYEYGVCKVKHSAAGNIESFLWCLSDHSDVDAAIASTTPPTKG